MPKQEEEFDFNHDFKGNHPANVKLADEKGPGNADQHEKTTVAENKAYEDAADPAGTEKEASDGEKTVEQTQKTLIKPKAEPRNKRVQLLLTESNHMKIKEYAANSGTSVNDAINQIIESI